MKTYNLARRSGGAGHGCPSDIYIEREREGECRRRQRERVYDIYLQREREGGGNGLWRLSGLLF